MVSAFARERLGPDNRAVLTYVPTDPEGQDSDSEAAVAVSA